jgi:hypothetical protein
MSDSGSYSDGGPIDPTKEGAKKENDPAINPEEHNSFSDSNDNKSEKSSDEGEEDKKRNEVRQEFTLQFEKKLAKYIPPKMKFEGDLRKKTLVNKALCPDKYSSDITIFKNYFLYTHQETLKILNKDLKNVYSVPIADNGNEIFGLSPVNNEYIIVVASDKVRIIFLNLEKEDKISHEVIQEIKETEYYCYSKKLNNGYLLLAGGDRKYYFYDLEKPEQKFGKDNKYKLIGKVDDVHNVYDDDFPYCIDLNNGRILSWLNDDKNIKIIEYYPEQKIIISKNGLQLHNAGLISDKYIILMGLTYPQYDSWLMDTETLEIVKHWVTPQNDSFVECYKENVFFYSSTSRIACDELIIKNGEFIRNNIYEVYYTEDKKENMDERFSIHNLIDEFTFITKTWNDKIMIYKCSK